MDSTIRIAFRFPLGAHHQLLRRPVNIAVKKADTVAELRERDGEVGGDG